jgi:hypothetical protein
MMTVQEMVRGLVRAAEFKEQEEAGKIWDDECRRALEAARARGWGLNQIGVLVDTEDLPDAVVQIARETIADSKWGRAFFGRPEVSVREAKLAAYVLKLHDDVAKYDAANREQGRLTGQLVTALEADRDAARAEIERLRGLNDAWASTAQETLRKYDESQIQLNEVRVALLLEQEVHAGTVKLLEAATKTIEEHRT